MGGTRSAFRNGRPAAAAGAFAGCENLESRLLLAAADPLGPAFTIGPTFDQDYILSGAVAGSYTGEIAAWFRSGGNVGLYAEHIGFDGWPESPIFELATPGPEVMVRHVAAAMNANGDYAVAWLSSSQADGLDRITVWRYSAGDISQAGGGDIVTSAASDGKPLGDVALALDASDNLYIVWEQLDSQAGQMTVWARKLDKSGSPVWPADLQIATGPSSWDMMPVVACDSGDFAVAWNDAGGIRLQLYATSGAVFGAQYLVAEAPVSQPALAMQSTGEVTVGWTATANGQKHVWTSDYNFETVGWVPAGPFMCQQPVESVSQLSLVPEHPNNAIAWLEQGTSSSSLYYWRSSAILPSTSVCLAAGLGGSSPLTMSVSTDGTAISQEPTGQGDILASRLGASRCLTIQANGGPLVLISNPVVTQDVQGRLFAWIQYDLGTFTYSVVAQRFYGTAIISPASYEPLTDLSVSSGPSLFFSWCRQGAAGPEICAQCVTPTLGLASDMPALASPMPNIDYETGWTVSQPQIAAIEATSPGLLIWREYQASTGATRIRVQQVGYSGQGNPVGYQPATTLASGNQQEVDDPSIAKAWDGSLAVWKSGTQDVYGLKLDATGNPTGPATLLWHLDGSNQFTDVKIEVPPGFGLAPFWRLSCTVTDTSTGATGLLYRDLSPDATTAGAPELVMVGGDARQYNPAIGVADDGTTHLLWTLDAAGQEGVFHSTIQPNGATPAEIQMLDYSLPGISGAVALASGPGGNSVAVWVQSDSALAATDVYAQLFTPLGAAAGPRLLVASVPAGDPNLPCKPDVDIDAAGEITIIWQLGSTGQGGFGVRRLKPDGTIDLDTAIAPPASGTNQDPAVAVDDAGNYAILWRHDEGDSQIDVQRYDRLGQAAGSTVEVVETPNYTFHAADLAMDARGDMEVVWPSGCCGGFGIWGVMLDGQNQPLTGAVLLVSSVYNQKTYDPVVAMAPDGDFTLAWRQYVPLGGQSLILARRFHGPVIPGDINRDMIVNAADIDALSAAIRAGSTDPQYDLNGDGCVDAADRDYLIGTILKTTPGDFDLSGDVTGHDFLLWQQNYPTLSGASWSQGDANGDSMVNGADFLIWQTNYHPLAPSSVQTVTLLPDSPAVQNIPSASEQPVIGQVAPMLAAYPPQAAALTRIAPAPALLAEPPKPALSILAPPTATAAPVSPVVFAMGAPAAMNQGLSDSPDSSADAAGPASGPLDILEGASPLAVRL